MKTINIFIFIVLSILCLGIASASTWGSGTQQEWQGGTSTTATTNAIGSNGIAVNFSSNFTGGIGMIRAYIVDGAVQPIKHY